MFPRPNTNSGCETGSETFALNLAFVVLARWLPGTSKLTPRSVLRHAGLFPCRPELVRSPGSIAEP